MCSSPTEDYAVYRPYVVTESILSNKQDIPFPPTHHQFYDDWPYDAFEHDYAKLLSFLHDEEGYSKDYLLINANYKEYDDQGLNGFEIIEAIIHFLEQKPFMSQEPSLINYSLPI